MDCVKCGVDPTVSPEQTPAEAMISHFISEHDLDNE